MNDFNIINNDINKIIKEKIDLRGINDNNFMMYIEKLKNFEQWLFFENHIRMNDENYIKIIKIIHELFNMEFDAAFAEYTNRNTLINTLINVQGINSYILSKCYQFFHSCNWNIISTKYVFTDEEIEKYKDYINKRCWITIIKQYKRNLNFIDKYINYFDKEIINILCMKYGKNID